MGNNIIEKEKTTPSVSIMKSPQVNPFPHVIKKKPKKSKIPQFGTSTFTAK